MSSTFFLISGCGSLSLDNQNDTPKQESKDHSKKEVAAFVYHRFGDSRYPSTNISTAQLERHLSYLKKNDFKSMTFGEAIDYLTNPDIAYEEKVVCITVDDGYKTFLTGAMPLLEKYGFKATLFINSESVGGNDFMTWEELKKIHEKGIEIGNHSHNHAYFLNLPDAERGAAFKKDIEKCQNLIHSHLGFYPDVFAFPYGEYDLAMKNALKSMGFKAAAAQNSGVMYNFDKYAMPRFPMAGPYTKMEGFIEKANMKALRIISKNPESPVARNGETPSLIIAFDNTGADLTRANCFFSSGCDMKLTGNQMTIKAKQPLTKRRTLCTITAPSANGNGWYWFSHLWIKPEIKE